jgi:hypothetical protein
MRIDWDVPVVMDDGLVLRADVYRPDEPGEFPVILSHGPYAKGQVFEAGYPAQWKGLLAQYPEALEGSSGQFTAWELLDPEHWVPHGYALVRVDSRGAGRSPGYLDVWGPREVRDFYDCIEWAGVQPWSNGKVGLAGISYFAKNQWQVAALRPPHLAAICPWEGANDYYRDQTHHGGIHNAFLPDWYARMDTIQHGVGSRGFRNPVTGLLAAGDNDLDDVELRAHREDLPALILAHPFDDEWHAEHSAPVEEIDVPLLSAGNWGGLGQHQRGNLLAWIAAGSKQKWLEVHGGTHWGAFYSNHGQELQRRFFDYFLKGTGDWSDQPRVSLHIRHPDGTTTLRAEQEWPLARTQWRTVYLDVATETLGADIPAETAERTYHALGTGITFWSAPFKEQTEITGALSARLWVSSSTRDADLFLVLRAFGPDGAEVLFQGANDPRTPLSQGWLRASHRAIDPARSTPWLPFHSHKSAEPLVVGEIYQVDVEIWSTCIVLPPGYQLALTVLGRDFDHGVESRQYRGSGPFLHEHPQDRPTAIFDNEVTLYSGPDMPASLLVPVVGP